MYRRLLTTAGYTVAAVSDGWDALQYLERQLPDAVVLDLALPRVQGLDVYRELRANPQTHAVSVVVVTGSDISPFEAADFRHFLRKPVNPEALVAAVGNALRRVSLS